MFGGTIGWMELLILALLGVLIFGKRLPEVGRSLGRGIVEFKKGLAGIEDDVDQAVKQPPRIERRDTGQTIDTHQATGQPSSTSGSGSGSA